MKKIGVRINKITNMVCSLVLALTIIIAVAFIDIAPALILAFCTILVLPLMLSLRLFLRDSLAGSFTETTNKRAMVSFLHAVLICALILSSSTIVELNRSSSYPAIGFPIQSTGAYSRTNDPSTITTPSEPSTNTTPSKPSTNVWLSNSEAKTLVDSAVWDALWEAMYSPIFIIAVAVTTCFGIIFFLMRRIHKKKNSLELALIEASVSFALVVFFALAGLLLFTFAVFWPILTSQNTEPAAAIRAIPVSNPASITPSTVATIGGAIIEIFAGIAMSVRAQSLKQVRYERNQALKEQILSRPIDHRTLSLLQELDKQTEKVD